MLRIHFVFLMMMFWQYTIDAQCYTTVGSPILFTSNGQNASTEYTTRYVLTDYNGVILKVSNTTFFTALNTPGAYKIYGINYRTSAGISNLIVGNHIDQLSGSCLDVGDAFSILVCNPAGSGCNTFNGTYSFNSTGGNTSLTTRYVLTDIQWNILQISAVPSCSGLSNGQFLIFPVNYQTISGLNIGSNFRDITGTCYDVGNPLLIKSCSPCTVSAGNDIELCSPTPITLTANAGVSGTYTWSTGQSGASSNVNPASSQTFRVTFTSTEGCVATDEVNVNIIGRPTAEAGPNVTICNGKQTVLSAQAVAGATYNWSNGATTRQITVSPVAAQTYIVTVSVGNCESMDFVTVFVNENPNAVITGNNVICSGKSTTLTASGGSSYVWSTGGNTANINVNPTGNTTYTVTVTNANGCTAVTSATVTVNTLPTAAITGNNVICSGTGTTLTASGGSSYVWSTGGNTGNINVNPTGNTTYTVTVTNANGCTAVTSATVTVNTLPTAAIIGNNVICSGTGTSLTASGGGSYVWSTGGNTANINVTPSVNTTYTVTVTNANGCTAVTSATVTVNTLPIAAITGNNVICSGTGTSLTASGGSSYVWSTGGNTANINVNPTGNTTYTVTVTNANGCTAVTSATVTVNICNLCDIYQCNIPCNGCEGTITFNATDQNPFLTTRYLLTNALGVIQKISSIPSFNDVTIGTWFIFGVNYDASKPFSGITVGGNIFSVTGACLDLGEPYVAKVCALPIADVTGNAVICNGASTILTASGGSNYAWSTGSNTTAITVNPSVGTTYTVTVTNANGCTAVKSATVAVNPTPVASITGNTIICGGASTTLTASGGSSYTWSNGGNTSSMNVNPIITTTYTVTVTNASGCTAVASSTVTVNACGKIGDFVWEDLNGNGIQDVGEPGIGGVTILLFKDGVQVGSTISDGNGMYMFSDLAPGNYTLLFPSLAGYTRTVTGRGTTDTDSNVNPTTGLLSITLSGSDTNVTLDAGYVRTASIGNYVWEDSNRNGVQDSGEIGIPNVVVNLTGTDGAGRIVNLSTQTDGNGLYQFNNLWPGAYTVTFVRPNEDFKSSNKDSVADDARDSDASGSTGQTDVIVLSSGQNNQTIDAGFYRCAKVGDYVWLDSGSNPNVQDQNDEGLDGIVVQLFSTTNPTAAEQTVVTYTNQGRKGYYQFEVCKEGQYFIKVFKPEEYNFVDARSGNGTNDSKVTNDIAGTTAVFTINYGVTIDTIDIGLEFKPLPVSLLEFTGYWDTDRDVNALQWITAIEINNDYFDVERSFEGEPFTSIGVVKGQGNSLTKQEYDFIDDDIEMNGVYSYRLRQVDFDGTETYSHVVKIRVDRYKEPTIKLFPNPAVTSSTLEVSGNENASYGLSIFDAAGKLVLKVEHSVHSDGWKYQLDATGLPRGVYHLMVSVNGEIRPMKWIVIE